MGQFPRGERDDVHVVAAVDDQHGKVEAGELSREIEIRRLLRGVSLMAFRLSRPHINPMIGQQCIDLRRSE